jgi:BirA family biotin operon repressor/biotin-[acetyl-CoA-carboxylase] ligase
VTPERLLHALADGEAHSGEALARRFGVTRAAVWKHVAKLGDWGLAVHAAAGVGYRLTRPIDLIDRDALRAALDARTAARLARLDVFTEIDSTNVRLLEAAPPPGRVDVCIAEYQHAGRGRRGRSWRTPLGGGLCLSVGWRFAETPPALSALGLADERKLGGILLELKAEAHGGCHVVAGIGLNVSLPAEMLRSLSDWPRGAVDLESAMGQSPPPRPAIAAALIDALAEMFEEYGAHGFAPYGGDFRAADYLKGRRVTIDAATGVLDALAVGIDQDGALIVETADGSRRRIVAGDVSVRSD